MPGSIVIDEFDVFCLNHKDRIIKDVTMFAKRSISRIISILINVILILSLLIGAIAFPISVRAASTITASTPDGTPS